MTAANRGKYAEGRVKARLRHLEGAYANFTHNRIADAHAAGGRAQPQPGDFQAFYLDPRQHAWNWLLEVKEVAHDYRLRHNNFSPDSVARMHKRHLAGSVCLVLVYHSTTKQWRCPPFEVFLSREGGSWDLRQYPIIALEGILDLCQQSYLLQPPELYLAAGLSRPT